MKEPEQHFSPDSIDLLTERFVRELPAQDSRLVADLYQTYAPSREENSRSLQRIWSRFEQVQEQYGPLKEGQGKSEGRELTQETRDVNVHAGRLSAPVAGTLRRSFWARLSSVVAVAVVVLIILSWVLLTHVFLIKPQTTLGASLTLGGGPQPNSNVVFLVKSSDGSQYLAGISFATYDGHTWRNSGVSSSQLLANKKTVSEGRPVHLITQQVTLVNPPDEQQPYILGAGQIASVDRPTTLLIGKTTGSQLAVLFNNSGPLTAGERYTVQSYVSSADIAELRSVALPTDVTNLLPNNNGLPPSTYYSPAILQAYLQLPSHLDPRIKDLAKQITASAPTMYDKAVALETYFRTHFTYDANIGVPSGQEPVSWFLFNSGNRGFCNYFATAMVIMARELGIPARIVEGYTNGTYDPTHNQWVVRDSDAHTWVQVYFAGYGWINFEPSPGFAPFSFTMA
jgi:hypothetical protein